MSKCKSNLCQSDAYSSGLCEYHLNHTELVIYTEGIGLVKSDSSQEQPIKSAQSNKGDTNDIDDIFRRLEERVEYNRHDMGEMGMFIRVGYVKNFLEDTKAIVKKWSAQETNKAAINELKHLEGGTDYWLDNGEVVKVSDRIAELGGKDV